jgi:hypothetical protein
MERPAVSSERSERSELSRFNAKPIHVIRHSVLEVTDICSALYERGVIHISGVQLLQTQAINLEFTLCSGT